MGDLLAKMQGGGVKGQFPACKQGAVGAQGPGLSLHRCRGLEMARGEHRWGSWPLCRANPTAPPPHHGREAASFLEGEAGGSRARAGGSGRWDSELGLHCSEALWREEISGAYLLGLWLSLGWPGTSVDGLSGLACGGVSWGGSGTGQAVPGQTPCDGHEQLPMSPSQAHGWGWKAVPCPHPPSSQRSHRKDDTEQGEQPPQSLLPGARGLRPTVGPGLGALRTPQCVTPTTALPRHAPGSN